MKPLDIRAEAELDIIEAALWYEDEREGMGAEVSFEVERTVGWRRAVEVLALTLGLFLATALVLLVSFRTLSPLLPRQP